MTPENENFEELRRLLKVKRYEQPPPGYFNDFSRQVIAQIRANSGQEREHLLDRLSWEVPWLQRLLEAFQAKPALAVSFGAAMCALLVGGVIYSESMEYKPAVVVSVPVKPVKQLPAPTSDSLFALGGVADGSTVAMGTNASLNPILQSGGSLFDQFSVNPERVAFQFNGNGN